MMIQQVERLAQFLPWTAMLCRRCVACTAGSNRASVKSVYGAGYGLVATFALHVDFMRTTRLSNSFTAKGVDCVGWAAGKTLCTATSAVSVIDAIDLRRMPALKRPLDEIAPCASSFFTLVRERLKCLTAATFCTRRALTAWSRTELCVAPSVSKITSKSRRPLPPFLPLQHLILALSLCTPTIR